LNLQIQLLQEELLDNVELVDALNGRTFSQKIASSTKDTEASLASRSQVTLSLSSRSRKYRYLVKTERHNEDYCWENILTSSSSGSDIF